MGLCKIGVDFNKKCKFLIDANPVLPESNNPWPEPVLISGVVGDHWQNDISHPVFVIFRKSYQNAGFTYKNTLFKQFLFLFPYQEELYLVRRIYQTHHIQACFFSGRLIL